MFFGTETEQIFKWIPIIQLTEGIKEHLEAINNK